MIMPRLRHYAVRHAFRRYYAAFEADAATL